MKNICLSLFKISFVYLFFLKNHEYLIKLVSSFDRESTQKYTEYKHVPSRSCFYSCSLYKNQLNQLHNIETYRVTYGVMGKKGKTDLRPEHRPFTIRTISWHITTQYRQWLPEGSLLATGSSCHL